MFVVEFRELPYLPPPQLVLSDWVLQRLGSWVGNIFSWVVVWVWVVLGDIIGC